jgi:hypothetical protein
MTIEAAFVIKLIAGALAGLSLMTGLIAAYLRYRSASSGLGAGEFRLLLDGDDDHKRLAAWLAEGANFNRWAAIWTAASVAAGGLCTALDHMA